MKYQHTFIAFVFAVISAVSAFAQQDNDSVVIQGYQFASASKGSVSSPTMSVVQDGGQFEKLNETLSLLNLAPGDFLDCRFKLPETAFNVKATIVYKGQDDGVKGRIRWNKTLLPEDQAVLLKGEGTGLTQKVISLEKFQRENELRIFSLGESLQILNVKITYSYRMPSCTVGDVTVKLLSPDSDKDVLGSDLKIEWAGTGPCDKGWVTIQYKDGEEWKTVPGAESFDLGDEEWKNATLGQFVWKNHGLKEFPELKIVYSEDESPKHREARLAAEAKAKAEQAERERKAQADQIAKEAQKLLQNKKYDEALAKIGEALKMYPDNDGYKQIKQGIEAAKDPLLVGGVKAGERIVKVVKGVEFAFRWCPAGTFMMGSPEGEDGRYQDETQHQVTLTKGFWIMETEVTQEQWQAVMGYPSYIAEKQLPKSNISWDECQKFCKQCTQLGLPVQLPTEAQWEYACRAGTTGPLNGNGYLYTMAWYKDNSYSRVHYVATKDSNAWGIYDMLGNVWEWCEDWKADYTNVNVTDPTGPLNGNGRIRRGSSWSCADRSCRPAYRGSSNPTDTGIDYGFRCVVNPNNADSSNSTSKNQSENVSIDILGKNVNNGGNAGERKVISFNGVEFAFRWCPAGTFTMGSPNDEDGRYSDEKQHLVTLTKGYWMMETEVTQKQWKAVMENTPSHFKGDDLPVENVSWEDCQKFCQKCEDLGLSVQLPTEAQWEYACRAGTLGRFSGVLDDMAWYFTIGNSESKTHPVGTKKPNIWGLYDMHGNVREWCADWKSNYPRNNITDPMGDINGTNRVQRGGAYASFERGCRSAVRMGNDPENREDIVGFRCVINPK